MKFPVSLNKARGEFCFRRIISNEIECFMGKIHQIGDEYYIEFHARGLLYQQKAGRDLKKAEELLRSTEEKIAKGELQAIVRDIDLDIFSTEFLNHARAQYHPATVRRLQSAIENFTAFIQAHSPQVKKLSQVTPRVIEDYKSHGIKKRQAVPGTLNPKIVNFTLLLLREILEYGIKTGFINDNPTLHVRLLEAEGRAKTVVSDAQITACLQSADRPYQDVLTFMRYTGLRPTEAVDLTWQQVDLNRNVVFVRLREIPLMAQALDILKSQGVDHKARVFQGESGGPVDPLELSESFAESARSAGLPAGSSMAVLRHVFAAELLGKHVSFLLTAKMMGISDIAKMMVFTADIPLSRKDIQP